MELNNYGEVLKLILETEGWTQTDLARELGLSQTWVSRVISGERDTPLRGAIEQLRGIGWDMRLAIGKEETNPVERREFTTKFAAAVAGVTVVPSTKASPYSDPDYLYTIAQRITDGMYEFGGTSASGTALRHVSRIRGALKGTDRKLQCAASKLARQSSLVLYDAQRMDDAEDAGKLALALARKSEDNSAQIDSCLELSLISTFQGKNERGAFYAENALRLPDRSPGQHAHALSRVGRALGGIRGHELQARRMLDKALGVDGLTSFEKGDVLGAVGVSYKEQREYQRADYVLDECVKLTESTSPLLRANYLARQVQAALGAGDASKAAALMHALANAAPLVASARLDGYMKEIATEAARWARVPEMRVALGHLRSVSAPAPGRTV